jgi:RHS repeat-associated protein
MKAPFNQPISSSSGYQNKLSERITNVMPKAFLRVLLAFYACSAANALAVTHDDKETMIPEFYIKFRGTGSGTPQLKVSYDAYKRYNETQEEMYTVSTDWKNGSGTDWITAYPLYVTNGMPLDIVGTLKVEGNNVAEYQIFINIPDPKYQPYVGPVESFRIQKTVNVTTDPFPHEFYVMFKRAGEGGAENGKASSAMPGWRNFKLGLGYGKTGKPLGYVTFVDGDKPMLPDSSQEVSLTEYSLSGQTIVQLYTPAATYNFSWDPDLQLENEFDEGGFVIEQFDRRSQPGTSTSDDNDIVYKNFSSFTPVTKFLLNYSPLEEDASYTTGKTRIRRIEGNQSMDSLATTARSVDSGSLARSCTTTCPPGGFSLCFTYCMTWWAVHPHASWISRVYDWVATAHSGDINCRVSSDIVSFTDHPISKSVTSSVELGTRKDSARFETGNSFYLWPDEDQFFLRDIDIYQGSTTASGLFTGNALYYTNLNTGRFLKLKSMIEPGGGWTFYDYYDEFDSRGMVKRIVRPFGDSPTSPPSSADAIAQGSMVTEFTYEAAWDGSKTLPSEVITKLKGSTTSADKVVSRSVYTYSTDTYAGLGVWVTTRKDYWGAGSSDYTTTVSKRFRPDAYRPFANLPFSEERPDGTKTLWNYETGTYNESDKTYSADTDLPPAAVLTGNELIVTAAGDSRFDGTYMYLENGYTGGGFGGAGQEAGYYRDGGTELYGITGDDVNGWTMWDALPSPYGQNAPSYHSDTLFSTWISDSSPPAPTVASRASEAAVREWKISCYPASAPGAVDLEIDGSYVVPNKSTAECKTRDKFGRLRRVDTFVYSDSSGWELLTSEAHDYDQGANLILSQKLMDGESPEEWIATYEAQYTDRNGSTTTYPTGSALTDFFNNTTSGSVHYTGRKQYERDRAGIIRKFYYDDYGRVSRVITLQPPDLGLSLAEPPASQTTFAYDADNRLVTNAIGPVTSSDWPPDSTALVTSTKYNNAGLPVEEVSVGGYTNKTDYSQIGSRIITRTSLGRDNATAYNREVSTSKYRDGRTKAVYSTGANSSASAIPEYHTYTIENLLGNVTISGTTMQVGTPREKVSRGSMNSHTVRYATTDTDWRGRKVTEASANPASLGDLQTTYSYNSKGQLSSTVVSGLAPVRYVYDDFGQLVQSGIDLNNNGTLDKASNERISEQETHFESIDDIWYEVASNTTYPYESSATPHTVQTTFVQKNGWARYGGLPLESAVYVYDALANESRTESYINRDYAFAWTKDFASTRSLNGDAMSQNGQPTYRFDVSDNTSTTWTYDAYGRVISTSGRTGTATVDYRSASAEVTWQKAPDNTWALTGYYPDGMVKVVTNYVEKSATQPAVTAAGKATRYDYNLRGQVTRVWGDAPHPVQNRYIQHGTSQDGSNLALEGELYEQWTYNGGSGWNGTAWPTSPGLSNNTRFVYEAETGLLKTNKYWTGTTFNRVRYTYNQRRDLKTRQWQRDATSTYKTTYNYKETSGDNTGELKEVLYDDPSETDLSYTYKRSGALASVTDAAGTRSFSYRSSDLQLDYQDLPSTLYGSGLKLGLKYDTVGRLSGYWHGALESSAAVSATYSFDSAKGWLQQIVNPLERFSYTYLYQSGVGGAPLISQIVNSAPGLYMPAITQSRTYAGDSDLLTGLSATRSAHSLPPVSLVGYQYFYDGLHRMTNLTQNGALHKGYWNGSYASGLTLRMGYNDRNELVAVTNFLSSSPDITGAAQLARRRFSFTYDTMGNRKSTQLDGDSLLNYTRNILGQYASRHNPTFVEVDGFVATDATIAGKLNNTTSFTPARQTWPDLDKDYFYSKPTRSASASRVETVELTTTTSTETKVEVRRVLARAASESFTYDTDGNLKTDAVWQYTYDAENRLKQIETLPALLTSFKTDAVQLKFKYDFLGRRVKKEVYNYTGTAWPGTPNAIYLYLYDGMTMIAEYVQDPTTSTRTLSKSYYWGLDLSVSLQGAGGVGGYLGMVDHLNGNAKYTAINDGNGNVAGLVDLSSGSLLAEYEYTPFGEPLRSADMAANLNPWRFSTKYYDAETGLLNYGYRYYSPSMGRFINRDPKDELGRLQFFAPLSGGNVAVWNYIGALVGTPGKSPSLTPRSSTGLDQSNERLGGFRNSTEPGNVLANRKGNLASGGGGSSYRPYSRGKAGGASHHYGFVNNNPFGAIDPMGLMILDTVNGLFGTSFWDPFGVGVPDMSWGIGSFESGGTPFGGWSFPDASTPIPYNDSYSLPEFCIPYNVSPYDFGDPNEYISRVRASVDFVSALRGEISWDQRYVDPNSELRAAESIATLLLSTVGAELMPRLGSLFAVESRTALGTAYRTAAKSETLTFFRGTTYYDALETVENTAFNLERILQRQAAAGHASDRLGLFLTSQEQTAGFYADLAGIQGRAGGPGMLRIEVPRAQFESLMGRYGIQYEVPVPRPPFPGQTETLIPPAAAAEFNSMMRVFHY